MSSIQARKLLLFAKRRHRNVAGRSVGDNTRGDTRTNTEALSCSGTKQTKRRQQQRDAAVVVVVVNKHVAGGAR